MKLTPIREYEWTEDYSFLRTLTCKNHPTARYLTKNPWNRSVHLLKRPEGDIERNDNGECTCPFNDLVVIEEESMPEENTMAENDDILRVNLSADTSHFEEGLNETLDAMEDAENAAKAQRLEDLHAWMHERYLLAYKLRNQEKMRSHAGTLYFIETGLRPYHDSPLDTGKEGDPHPAFHEFEQHLFESVKDAVVEDPLHHLDLGRVRKEGE